MEIIKSILMFLGLSDSIATTLASFSTSWSVTVIVVVLLIRYLLVPIISKSLGNAIEKYFSRGEQIVNKLDEFLVDQKEIKEKTLKIDSMVEELVDDSVGNLDSRLALSTFSVFMNSVNMRMFIFYNRRCKVNHIVGNEEIVQGRYSSKSEELKSKTETQLSKYYYKGQPLSLFFGKDGLDSFFRHIMTELYNIQLLKAQGDKFCLSLTDEDIENAFDRLLSKLMGAFKLWCDTGRTYQETKGNYNMHLFTNEQINEIEEL